ncbi:FHA domain-containing protein [Streptomyces sp. J2-1]|uniref:FHA domain-containing protein n=1 Tax=Streptomyces corallincola TaxID=2851888 RepID=UPI001C3830D5|nr:FHA domain-containing protein [Streptomyces corallincola]MBV2357499.1 FHA domain-containing protein [Streptomyces corallincola]
MPTCPNGHQSGSEEWCGVCGHRMAGAVPPPPPPPHGGYGFPPQGTHPGTPEPELCPQCRTPREGRAPFCEECRWNYLTNTPTPAAPRPPQPRFDPPSATYGGGGPYEYQGSRPSQRHRGAEPIPPFGGEPSGPTPFPPEQIGPGAPGQGVYQQAGAPVPPAYPREGGPGYGGGDWELPPPGGGQNDYGHPQGGGRQATGFPQAPQAPVTWTATIGPDRDYFTAMMHRSGPEATGLNLPAYSPEQRRTLTGDRITIGRRRHSTGDTPDIDLAVPPEDPGVSHQHAVLEQQPDGSWAVVDQNSTNGTTVNGSDEPIRPFVPVPLRDGDRVHVGAWTTITVRRG